MTRRWRVIRSIMYAVTGLAFIGTIYEYGLAVNRGAIPPWVDSLVSYAWALIVVVLILTVTPLREKRWIGDLSKERFALTVDERLLFRSRFMSGEFYKSADAFNPRPTLRQWLSGGPINIVRLLEVDLTTRRFSFGRFAGPTYRIVPLAAIRSWSEVNGRWPYRNALLIDYEFMQRREAILVWTKSKGHRQLRRALASIAPTSAAHGSRADVDISLRGRGHEPVG